MPLFASGKSGAVKLTIQKFYRIKGGSTQLRGVASDIVLPSVTDQADVGEGSLKNPLDYDEVPARGFTPAGNIGALVPKLRAASEARVAGDPEFAYVREDTARFRTQFDKNAVSLNKTTRLAEIEQDKARRETRLAERKDRKQPALAAVEVTLDTVDEPKLQKVALDQPPKRAAEEMTEDEDPSAPDEQEIFVDPIRDETVRILLDTIRLQGAPPITARADTPPANNP
jgi:carboxyl-terminal processing protease